MKKSAPLAPAVLQAQKAEVIRAAEAAHAEFKQYRGQWSGPEWRLARVRRRTVTKFGLAFDAGEVTVCKRSDLRNMGSQIVAYSAKNRIGTTLPETGIEWLEEPPPALEVRE